MISCLFREPYQGADVTQKRSKIFWIKRICTEKGDTEEKIVI